MIPLFLVSQPRSGSTLLQAIVSNHERVATTSEPWVQLLSQGLMRKDLVEAPFNWSWTLSALGHNSENYDLMDDLKKALANFSNSFYDRNTAMETEHYFLDKTPRYYFILEELFVAYPEARFIILHRDQASVVHSIWKTWLSERHSKSLDIFSWDLIEAPKLMRKFEEKYGDSTRVYSTSYECILSDPEHELAKLFRWLDLDFSSSLLDYSKNKSFIGGFGDPTGIHRGRLKPSKPRSSPLCYKTKFNNLTVSLIAKGLSAHHDSSGTEPRVTGLWEPSRMNLTFKRYLFRHNLRVNRRSREDQLPGLKESVLLLADRIISRFKP